MAICSSSSVCQEDGKRATHVNGKLISRALEKAAECEKLGMRMC